MSHTYLGDSTFGGHRTAKKTYECRECEGVILSGSRYWYGIAMPDADVNSSRTGQPWILRICVRCQPEKVS